MRYLKTNAIMCIFRKLINNGNMQSEKGFTDPDRHSLLPNISPAKTGFSAALPLYCSLQKPIKQILKEGIAVNRGGC